MFSPSRRAVLAAAFAFAVAGPAMAQDRAITLASTTSTENSGLLKHLTPIFQAETGIGVRVVAVGTGQAFEIARRGDADALLVHDRKGEDAFVADGAGVDRRDVMFNDFVVVGPKADPAGVAGLKDVVAAFGKIAAAKARFASRGDDSGTHRMELRLWREAGLDVKTQGGGWHRELGQGMGATLNTAAASDAYALTDRATWASFKNRQGLAIVVEGDAKLANPYGSILVNPARHPHVKAADAQAWHVWLTGPKGQAAIAGFKIDGEQLFFPSAKAGS